MRRLILTLVAIISASCQYEPEQPGLCKLSCSKAAITGNDAAIQIQRKSSDLALTCSAAAEGQDIEEPFVAQFLIGEVFTGVTDDTEEIRPIPSVSFEPIVNGLRSDDPTRSPNTTIVNNQITPARYKGIVTPKDNWCTDTCGVATIEVFARCPPTGATSELTVQIHSGANFSDDENTATFTVSTLEPPDANLRKAETKPLSPDAE